MIPCHTDQTTKNALESRLFNRFRKSVTVRNEAIHSPKYSVVIDESDVGNSGLGENKTRHQPFINRVCEAVAV